MLLGVENFLKNHVATVRDLRVGLLAHAASVTQRLSSTVEEFFNQQAIDLKLLFAPEHGLFGAAQDMEAVGEERDPRTKLRVLSLYGRDVDSLTPKAKDLKDIDVLVIDLQDVGVRYYTYIYTMALSLKACGEAKIPVIILDRPNPLGGEGVEGNLLNPSFASFVGFYPLPVRHGMTIGELAQYFNDTQNFCCTLTVIPMIGWQRAMHFDNTGLTWIPPSPNMPTFNTASVYAGSCLIEATEISEGRGTTKPFEWLGAPFIDAVKFCQHLNSQAFPGVHFRPISFKPSFHKYAGKLCHGTQIHITDHKTYQSYNTGLHVIKALHDLYPHHFAWRDKPYEFVTDRPAIDLLTGTDLFRKGLESPHCLKEFFELCQTGTEEFLKERGDYIMY